MSLTPIEKETVIIFNEAEDKAEITTYNKSLIRRLKSYGEQGENVNFIKRLQGGAYKFEVPKEWILKLSKPRRYKLSEEQKRDRATRLGIL